MHHPSSDKVVTTHHATYFSPRLIPYYRGHCPNLKFDYGQTYGMATAKQLQDFRLSVLASSQTPYCKGGQIPTFYTHNPDLVSENSRAGRERSSGYFKSDLYNQDFDRSEEISRFNLLAQQHRQQYKDKTGTLKSVPEFHIPSAHLDRIRNRYMN
ncbi:unnamed protein product [Calicophoron daubneyi]|uniref:Ciliary microtubule inner protein 2C n=1 Tax=Calicophoron daubneyi TaxID=300641 RepID=A0AAV2TDL5_CALDB